MMRLRGFTLVELLVVIGIIAVLSSLLLWGIGEARVKAMILISTKRMDQVSLGLQQYEAEGGSVAAALLAKPLASPLRFAPMREIISDLAKPKWTGNIYSSSIGDNLVPPNFRYKDNSGDYREETRAYWFPGNTNTSKIGESFESTLDIMPFPTLVPTRPNKTWYRTQWPVAWPASDWDAATPGPILPYWGTPWGRPAWKTATSSAGYVYRNGELDVTLEPRNASQLSPLASAAFLRAAGILTGATWAEDYRTNRNPDREWNDRWGNPLIVSYAAFIPNRHDTRNAEADDTYISAMRPRDFLITRSREAHGYWRSLYLTVGALGPQVPSAVLATAGLTTIPSWTAAQEPLVLATFGKHIATVCKASEWNENGFAKPPWQGVRKEKAAGGVLCLLLAPLEIR